MTRILVVALLGVALTACTAKVKSPEAEVEFPRVKVEIGDSHGGDFCPPGQAKKGRC